MTLLQVDGLTKGYGGLRAVSGLSFSVERGTVVGIIGPNGAGKTTSFEMISETSASDLSGSIRLLYCS